MVLLNISLSWSCHAPLLPTLNTNTHPACTSKLIQSPLDFYFSQDEAEQFFFFLLGHFSMIALYSLILVWYVLFNRQPFICILIGEKGLILQVTKGWKWLLPPAPFQSRVNLHCHYSEPRFCSWCEQCRALAAQDAVSKLLERSSSHFSFCLQSTLQDQGGQWIWVGHWRKGGSLAFVLEK